MSRIKRCIRSRYGNGCIVEIDYKQLEVVVLACLSNDQVLIDDLNGGLDMHSMSATFLQPEMSYEVLKARYDAEDQTIISLRKKAKACSFLVQFGGGAKTLSNNTGITITLAERFIENYYDRYKTVGAWQDTVADVVTRNTFAYEGKLVGQYVSPTGTRYLFRKEAPPWDANGTKRFKPTELKNYPIQGTAADIVKTGLALLVPTVKEIWGDDVLVINTVHDSFILDVKDPTILPEIARICRHVLTKEVQETITETTEMEWPVNLAVDIEAGDNWGELTEVNKYVESKLFE